MVELLIQVTAERYLKYSTRDAVLAQTLWLNDGNWTDDATGSSALERQLKIGSKVGTASELLEFLRKQLLKDLCLGVDSDIEWENLPSEARQYLMDRCTGIFYSLTQEQAAVLSKQLHLSSGISFETHVERSNYAALTSTISLNRASSWFSENISSQSGQLSRAASLPVLPVVDLHEHTATPPIYSFYDKIRVSLGTVYHYLGTLCKFFSIAFVADPEYQREVTHAFPRASHPGNYIVRSILLGIWLWSKRVQQFLLPFFLVSTPVNSLA